MADSDSEFRIKAVIDATGATAGADKTAADVDRIARETQAATVVAEKFGITLAEARKVLADMAREDQAVKLAAVKNELRSAAQAADEVAVATAPAALEVDKLGAVGERASHVFGSLRSARHPLMAIGEIARGGTSAVAGLAMEGRVLAEVFESIIPGIGPLIAAFTLLSVGAQMWSRSEESAEKSTDKATEAADKQAKKIDELQQRAATAYPDVLKYLEAVTKELSAQTIATEKLERANQELEDAKISEKLAQLDNEEDAALIGKGADQRGAIQQNYAEKRLKLKKELDDKKAQDEVKAKQEELDKANKDLTDAQAQIASLGQQLAQAHNVVNGRAQAGLDSAGVKSDAQAAADRMEQLRNLNNSLDATGARRGLSPQEGQEYQDLQRDVSKMQDREAVMGKSFDDQLKAQQAKKDAADKEAAKDSDPSFLSKITDPGIIFNFQERAAKARAESEAAQKQIDAILAYQAEMKAAKDELEKGVPKFQELNSSIETLKLNIDAAAKNLAAAKTKADTTDLRGQDAIAKQDAQAGNAAAERAYENREAARKANIDKLDDEIARTGDQTLKAILGKQKTRIEASGIEDKARTDLSEGKITRGQYDEAMTRVGIDRNNAKGHDDKLVDQIKATITGSGDKDAIAQMKDILIKDKNDLSKQILDLLNVHITTQTTINRITMEGLAQVKQSQVEHGRALKSAVNNGGNGG